MQLAPDVSALDQIVIYDAMPVGYFLQLLIGSDAKSVNGVGGKA